MYYVNIWIYPCFDDHSNIQGPPRGCPNFHHNDSGYFWHKIQQIGWKPCLILDSLLQCSAHLSERLRYCVFLQYWSVSSICTCPWVSDNSGLMGIQYVTTKEESTSNPVTLFAFTLHPNQRCWLVTHKIDWQLTQAIICGMPFSKCQLWEHLDWM